MMYEVGATGVHQIDRDSSSAPVLGLKLLSISFRVHQGQMPPSWGLWAFAVGWSLGVVRVRGQWNSSD